MLGPSDTDRKLDWKLKDVADWFGVTTMTVRRWMAKEQNPLPHYRPGGGSPRFCSVEVKEWGFSQ